MDDEEEWMDNQDASGIFTDQHAHILLNSDFSHIAETDEEKEHNLASLAATSDMVGYTTEPLLEQSVREITGTNDLTQDDLQLFETSGEQTLAAFSEDIPRTEQDISHPYDIPHTSDDFSHVVSETLTITSSTNALDGIQLNLNFAELPATLAPSTAAFFSDKDNNTTPEIIACMPGTSEDRQEDLGLLLGGLHRYFYSRCAAGDLEVLLFCLQHLFKSTTRLYEGILPELATCRLRQTTPSHEAHDLLAIYCTWTQLHLLSGLLARVESLGHLMVSAVLNILDALDVTSLPRLDPPPDKLPKQSLPSLEQWQQATGQIHKRLLAWDQDWFQRLLFTNQFAHIPELNRELTRLDNNTELILTHTRVIFGELLPALRTLKQNNEVGAALLFDLAQQVDQIQCAASAQQEPLLQLLQKHAQYAIE
jgi:hypothetical protein